MRNIFKIFIFRILSLVLICTSILTFTNFKVYAQNTDLNITSTASLETVKTGDVIEIKVIMENYDDKSISDIGGLQIDISIDENYLEFVDKSNKSLLKLENGDYINGAYNSAKRTFTYMYAYMNPDEIPLGRDNTEIVSFELKIKAAAEDSGVLEIPVKAKIADTNSPANSIKASVEPIKLMFPTKSENSGEQEESKTESENKGNQTSSYSSEITVEKQENQIIIPIDRENTNFKWDKITIKGTDNKNISASVTEQGILIQGDDLGDIIITAERNSEQSGIKIDPPAESESEPIKQILIKDGGNNISAYSDENENSSFDTEIGGDLTEEIENNKSTVWIIISAVGLIIIFAAVAFCFKKRSQIKKG